MPKTIRLVLHHCQHCDGPAIYCVLDDDKTLKPMYRDSAVCIGCGSTFLPSQLTGKEDISGPIDWSGQSDS
jgi:hypothetical protein